MVRKDDFSIQVFENAYTEKQEKNPQRQDRALVASSKHHFYDF